MTRDYAKVLVPLMEMKIFSIQPEHGVTSGVLVQLNTRKQDVVIMLLAISFVHHHTGNGMLPRLHNASSREKSLRTLSNGEVSGHRQAEIRVRADTTYSIRGCNDREKNTDFLTSLEKFNEQQDP